MTKPNMSVKDRFDQYIDRTPNEKGCWIWTGARQKRFRYGTFGIGGKMYLSHRISYSLFKGEIPDKLHVLHTCDVPYCVNPEHLFVGTHQDNMDDKERKGRGNQLKGQNHSNAKLTESDVIHIRESKETLKSLASKFNVSFGLIGHIRNRRVWKHI